MTPLKVLLTDDHQLVLDGLQNILADVSDIEVIGQAPNGAKAIEIIEMLPVDLVLMDIDMPIMNGLEATAKIKQKYPHIKIIILSMHNERSIIQKIMSLNADGYLLKNSDKSEFIKAIQIVAGGKKFFSSDVAITLMSEENKKNESKLSTLANLTEREREILKLVAEGLSNKQIGDELFISHRTVDTHRTNLMKKLEVKNVAGLVKFAVRNGLVD